MGGSTTWSNTGAGGKLKELGTTNWKSPNTDATNSSLFTALPGGGRYDSGGYAYIGGSGTWWSSTVYDINRSWSRIMDYNYGHAYGRVNNNKNGFSIRCLRD